MRTTPLLLLAACTAGRPVTDDADPGPIVDDYEVPDGVTTSLYDPEHRLLTFPDLAQTVPDAGTGTGLRLRLTDGARADLGAVLPEGFNLFDALEELDGFGLNAGVVLRFSAPVDPAAIAAATRWVRVADGAPMGFEAWSTDEGATVVLDPLLPLEPGTAYALVVDKGVTDLAGGEIWPSPALHRMLYGADGAGAPSVLEAWADAAEVLGVGADDVAAGTVFVTQTSRTQDLAVADVLLAEELTLVKDGDCVHEGVVTSCPATLVVGDPVGEDGTIGPDEAPAIQRTYTLKVSVFLPGDGQDGPYPVALFGHGLLGDRGEAHGYARQVAGDGLAVIGIDAPAHGDHPTYKPQIIADLSSLWFFGVDIATKSMDVKRLRDNWRLAAFDKLQVAAAARAGFDADGDGDDDFDHGPMHWAGHSLGSVMGSQLVAMDDHFVSAYLSVPGGRVSEIVHRGQIFAPLVSLMAPEGIGQGDVDRFFPLLQTAIDRGDPATWAGLVVDGHRDVFAQMVIDDDIIPNACTRYLARALGLELVGPELQQVEGLAVHDGGFPVQGNVGGRTAALLQLDDMVDDGVVVDAVHTHIFGSETNERLMHGWYQAVLAGQPGVAVDPEVPAPE
jgi:hypothetical protein